MLKGKKIVLGITGGIAAYKACELARLLIKQGAEVRAVMSANAQKFICPLTLETLTGNQVAVDTFEHAWEIEHISLAKFADLMIIAPATANIIGKIANGIADDILSTSVMAMPCPVLIAPAMNTVMWKSAANQANIQKLTDRSFLFCGPQRGFLACGDEDVGRMSEPDQIVHAAGAILNTKKDLADKTVLVTAGPTREMLDPVRFITNRSTGRMGYALAEAARDRGARVELVSGPVNIQRPSGVNMHDVVSTQDMYACVTELAKTADIVVQSAAPADFTVPNASEQKIKKTGSGMLLKLENTPDIAAAIGKAKRPGQVLVAFAAETEASVKKADAKRKRKNADMIVLNDVTKAGAGFGTETNIVTIITDDGSKDYPLMSKREVADAILDEALRIAKEHSCATQE